MIVKDFIKKNQTTRKTIAVIGDFMVDEYWYTATNRLSPEFPIPVMLCSSEELNYQKPGGAANCAYQLTRFNVDIKPVGLINQYAESVYEMAMKNADFRFCVFGNFNLPIKKRYYSNDFPLCRLDEERPNYGIENISHLRKSLFENLQALIKECKTDALIVSDYDKGVFDQDLAQKIIAACQTANIPVVVDPKKNPHYWHKCSVFKPNIAEAASFLNITQKEFMSNWETHTLNLKHLIECKTLIITNSNEGVLGTSENGLFYFKPENKHKTVRSVIGAGDCFIATLTLALTHNIGIEDAVKISYNAASVYVQKNHNEPVYPHEIYSIEEPSKSKILSPSELVLICEEYREKKKRIVITNGCFDVIHQGHIRTLEFAKNQGDILIVALNDDESIRRLKGPKRPINNFGCRSEIVAALACVDHVTQFTEDVPTALFNKIIPSAIVKGSEYGVTQVAGSNKYEVVLAPMYEGLSTSNMLKKIQSDS